MGFQGISAALTKEIRKTKELEEGQGVFLLYLEILENVDILEILDISPVKRPLS